MTRPLPFRLLMLAAAATLAAPALSQTVTPTPPSAQSSPTAQTSPSAQTSQSGQTSGTARTSTPAPATTAAEYVRMAASGDLYEKTSSRLVRTTRNQNVRRFAQMMMSDHDRTTQSVATAARRDNVTVPAPAMLPKHARLIDDLKAVPTKSRVNLYLQQQLQAHEEALALHQGYARDGDKPALRRAAAAAVPIVEKHLARVRTLQPATASR